MTKGTIKKQLRYEQKMLKKAKDFMLKTEGYAGIACSGSADIGFYEGRIALLESRLREESRNR